jgi:hypothetical protein
VIKMGNEKKRKPYSLRTKYESGLRFNNFVIIKQSETIITKCGRKYTAWECKCDCGNIFIGRTKEIKKGKKSCGCLSKNNQFKKTDSDLAIRNIKYNHYRYSAKSRNLDWNLDKEQFYKLIYGDCHYCGHPPMNEVNKNNHMMLVNGVDRVNSKGGYNKENVVSCCRICNFAKGSLSCDEFEEWIKRLVKFKNK